MSSELASKYNPAEVEPLIAKRWEACGAFAADPAAPGDPYAIVIPPPNVTAALHMGHALNNNLQDILTRWHRMLGESTLWMPGTDHAGIATQTVVERRVLAEEGKRRTDFSRDQFIKKIQAWKDEYEVRITEQLVAMGCSCDWKRQRFTMDPICAQAVREAFFRLFADGLIYRGKRLVNWDPVTQTALADDEVEMQEIDGNFWYLRYPIVNEAGQDSGEFVTVATTRPETMLGDTAVAVNPADPIPAAFIGRKVRLPIVNRIVPIIGDDYVAIADPDGDDPKARYASGYLKVTPGHDPNDWQIGLRHDLQVINVLAPDGTISNEHGWEDVGEGVFLLGLSRDEARKAVVDWFKQHGLLEEVRPYRHAVGHSYRSHAPIEPYLSDQWYVKVTDDRLAGAALFAMAKDQRSDSGGCVWKSEGAFDTGHGARDAGQVNWFGKLRFYPSRYARTFQLWHENIRDWCISRQLWWGHRIPVWSRAGAAAAGFESGDSVAVRKDGEVTYICVRNEDPKIIEQLEAAGFEQDPDVLDTWFSSGLWPLSTMGWPDPAAFPDQIPEGNAVLDRWNPTNVLCTAREIITLWVSRMVMFNIYLRGCLPFAEVFIHAMIQDGHGQKMSKSLGNGVDPLDIIHGHGADAMRFALAKMATHTQDVRMPVDLICPHTGRTFEPKFITIKGHIKVAAPIQECPTDLAKKMVSSYGVASGKATPTAEMPLARNTSVKFDEGRNFANKLWNAVRFALTNLENAPASSGGEDLSAPSDTLAECWILSRLAATVEQTDGALRAYEFHNYVQGLYTFIWGDFCDWYIEVVKPTLRENAHQQQVVATVLDVVLRLLHPVMPYVTEQLWEQLNQVVPKRGVEGVVIPASQLLVKAAWPAVDPALGDPQAEQAFGLIVDAVGAAREVRTSHKIAPREKVGLAIEAPEPIAATCQLHRSYVETLANVQYHPKLPQFEGKAMPGTATAGEIMVYVFRSDGGLVDQDAEKNRLESGLAELSKSIQRLKSRLTNKGYTEKAPARLVQQTRDELVAKQQEAATLEQKLTALK